MADDTDKGGDSQNPPKEKAKRVRVIFAGGTLGHLGLKGGDITENEDYVGLLKTKRGRTLVEEVK